MNKPLRSYSDHEIANYVLGIDLPKNISEGIQYKLAADDAAAARALKWEAYFLSLVDGLEPLKPAADNLENIQKTLNISIDAADNENQSLDQITDAFANSTEAGQIFSRKKRISKLSKVIGAIVVFIVILIALISFKAPVEQSITQQTIDLKK